jgi:hypothetical protein
VNQYKTRLPNFPVDNMNMYVLYDFSCLLSASTSPFEPYQLNL